MVQIRHWPVVAEAAGRGLLPGDESGDGDLLGLLELAEYLQVAPGELERLVHDGLLPAEELGGRWRFRPREVDTWLDLGLVGWGTSALRALAGTGRKRPSLEGALTADHVLLDLVTADWVECFRRTVGSLRLSQEVERAPVLQALLERERLCSTVLDNGFALPHTTRMGPRFVGENVVALVRSAAPIPLNEGNSVDLFFFVLAADQASHLILLSRVTALARLPSFGPALRAAPNSTQALRVVREAERQWFHKLA